MRHVLKFFLLGLCSIFSVSCGEDEGSTDLNFVSVNFSTTSINIVEDNDENGITILFDDKVPIDGQLKVEISGSAIYKNDYTTQPEGSSGELTIDVKAGDTSKTIKVLPVNDNIYNQERTVIFTIKGATDRIKLGSDLVHTTTINDDDEAPLTIASLKAKYEANGNIDFTQGYIRGVMISSKSNGFNFLNRTLILQDNTDGIAVRLNTKNTDFDLGDELVIDLNGGTLEAYNDLIRIKGIELASVNNLGKGNLPQPEVITPTKLLTGDYQSRLVTVTEVAFSDADGKQKFQGNMVGSMINTKSDGFLQTRFSSGSAFDGTIIPVGLGKMTGVAITFFGDKNGLLLRNLEDLDLTEIATLKLVTDGTDFGQVIGGEYSVTKTYQLSVSSGFPMIDPLLGFTGIDGTNILELSYKKSEFQNSVFVPKEDLADGPVDILVRLHPNKEMNGTIQNILHIQSFAVASIRQNLTVEVVSGN